MKIERYNEYIRPNFKFKVGDWVKINSKLMGDQDMSHPILTIFLDNNIGKIIDYDRVRVLVKFFDVPSTLKTIIINNTKSFKLSRIMDYDSNKSELEERLRIEKDIKKYNL